MAHELWEQSDPSILIGKDALPKLSFQYISVSYSAACGKFVQRIMTTIRINRGTHRTPSARPNRKILPRGSRNKVDGDVPEVPKSLAVVQSALSRPERPARSPLLASALQESDIDDVQMFADFFESYVPPSVKIWRQMTYLRVVTDTTPVTPLLKRAKRTLGLVHLAALSQDPRLIRESRISYARFLGQLQFQLALPPSAKSSLELRELAASIALMTHLSDPAPDTSAKDDGWVTHLWGAQQLLSIHGPSRLHRADRPTSGLLRHVFHNAFQLAVAKRKAWNADPDWLRSVPSHGWTTYVTAFCKLPELLEFTDQALAHSHTTEALMEILARLRQVQDEGSHLFPDAGNPKSIDVRSTDSLTPDVEEHMVMAGSKTFPDLWKPMDDPATLHRFVVPTHVLLVTECTILRIWHFRPDTLLTVSSEEQRRVEEHVFRLARNLCKAALSFTANDKLIYAIWLRMYLALARNVFEQQGAVPELGWCDACLIANDLRVERLRKTRTPTLCKLEDVMSGTAEAGRYKSKFDPGAFVIRSAPDHGLRLLQ